MTEVSINKSIRLSQHYTLGEMTKTGTGIPNIPSRVNIGVTRCQARCYLDNHIFRVFLVVCDYFLIFAPTIPILSIISDSRLEIYV